MKNAVLILLISVTSFCFSQEEDWVQAKGEITEIILHRGKTFKSSAMIKFNLEDGTEQIGIVELFRIPFIGNMSSIGDKITINYHRNNPSIVKTNSGKFLSSYGMYILIFLGIILSIKPFLKLKYEKKNYE